MKTTGLLASLCAAMLASSIPVAAQQAPTPLPSAASIAPTIGQLREIGTVKAKSRFCAALDAGAGSAARSSIAYEALLYRTALDFAALNLDDALHKERATNRLEQDVRALGILATTGRSDLERLQHTAEFAPAGGASAAVAVRNAMDGAKARQYELAKQLAQAVSVVESRRLYTATDLPVDNVGGALEVLDRSFFSTRQDQVLDEASHALVANFPDNDGIVQDLKTAGANAEAALKLGNCTTP